MSLDRELPYVGQNVTVSGFGDASVTRVIHRGRLFDVCEVQIGSDRMCLKSPGVNASTRPGTAGFAGHDSFVGTSLWGGAYSSWSSEADASVAVRSALLTAESETVRQTHGAWNHGVLCMSTWDGASVLHADDAARPFSHLAPDRYRLALLMPLHPGQTLDALPPQVQRQLLPRMLPALWDALTAAAHRDVSMANIIVTPDRTRFSLIDPGVAVWSSIYGSMFADSEVILTTTASQYPLLPPTYEWPVDLAASAGLVNHLEWLRTITLAGHDASRSGLPPWCNRAPTRQQRSDTRPSAADLLAVGIMYFHALTGASAFDSRLQSPAWVGSYGHDSDRQQATHYGHALQALGGGPPLPSSRRVDITPAEDRLAIGLLDLRITSREELVARTQEVIGTA